MKACRFAFLLTVALAGCQSASPTLEADNFRLPPQSRYACDNGEALAIDNKGSMVTVTRADGSAIDLPAVEPGSNSRFSAGQVALVFDGSSALYMDTGKPVLTCKRG